MIPLTRDRVAKIIETERRTVVARAKREQRVESHSVRDIEFQFYKMKRDMDGWWQWLHNLINVFNTTELHT